MSKQFIKNSEERKTLVEEINQLKLQIKHIKSGISQKKRSIISIEDKNPNLIDENEIIMSTTQLNNKIQRVWQGTIAIEKVNYRIISENINLVQNNETIKDDIKLIQEEICKSKDIKEHLFKRIEQEKALLIKVKDIAQKMHLSVNEIIKYNSKLRKDIKQKEKAKYKLQEKANKILD